MKKLTPLLIAMLFLFGCSSSLKISDFDDTKDIVVINDILTDKSKKLDFELTSIEENENTYTLAYKHEDGSSLRFSYNKKQQIKTFEILKDGDKRKAYGAYLKITSSTLDVIQDLINNPESYEKMKEAYPNGKGTYTIGNTRYGKCTVSNKNNKFVMRFDYHK